MLATESTLDRPVSLRRPPPALPARPAVATPHDIAELRQVVPVDLDGAEPADADDQDAPSWDLVAPTSLLVDDAYQRNLSPKSLALIRRIVAGWSWSKFKPPVCARVDGALHVIDGQHTAIAAASHGGVPLIPVLVVPAPKMVDRAAAFVSHAVDRLQVKRTQVWHAAVAAGDADALTVRNVLDRAGVTMLSYAPGSNVFGKAETIAIGAVQKLVDGRGAMRAREVLEILARAELAPITADHVRIAEALLLDPEYAGGLDAGRITAALRDVTPKQLGDAKALAHRGRMPVWQALAAVLGRAHASGKRGRAKAAKASTPPAPATADAAPTATTPATAARAPGIGDVPMAALLDGIERWRRGEPWDAGWGPAPGEPSCAVPASLLGAELTIIGTRRREAVVDHVAASWRLRRAWPAKGWGPAPDDPDCALPRRFLEPEPVA